MTIKEKILAEETEYPSNFSEIINGNGYTAYYFTENKELHEGNHAVIYPDKIKDLKYVLSEIKKIYSEMGIKASVYHPFGDKHYNYFNENKEIIKECGYEITLDEDYRFLILSGDNKIIRNKSLDIKLLNCWDESIENDIIIPSGEYWELESTKKFTTEKNSFLFSGYIGNKAVVYSVIHKSKKYDCVRFDYILCANQYRGKGYGSELISYIVDFCGENGFNNCFQLAGPSENIVRKAGFRDSFTAKAGRINVV